MVREHKEVRLNRRTSTNRWEVVRLAEDGSVITDRWPLHEEDSGLLDALLDRSPGRKDIEEALATVPGMEDQRLLEEATDAVMEVLYGH